MDERDHWKWIRRIAALALMLALAAAWIRISRG